MLLSYRDWAPTWWHTWKCLGPPAGKNCSGVFLSECCGFTAIPTDAPPPPAAALQAHFEEQAASNVQGLSRAKAINQRREDDKLKRTRQDGDKDLASPALKSDKSTTDSQAVTVDSRAVQGAMLIDIERRKEQMAHRDRQIERLNWLIKRAQSKSPILQEQPYGSKNLKNCTKHRCRTLSSQLL
jgi:hypothetical protein